MDTSSEDGSSEEDQLHGIEAKSNRESRQKGKSKPSSFLDGTLESAMRRYSLRSDAGAAPATTVKTKGKKSKTSKKDFIKNTRSESLADEDFIPTLGIDVHGADISNPDVHATDKELEMHNHEGDYGINQILNRDLVVDTSMANPVKVGGEPDYQQVLLNQEYLGNSILDNLSTAMTTDMDIVKGVDPEVNSKYQNLASSISMQEVSSEGTLGAWEKICYLFQQISWPREWGTVDPSLNAQWESNLSAKLRKTPEKVVNVDQVKALFNLLKEPVASMEYEVCDNHFAEDNIMVALLCRWQALVKKDHINMPEGPVLNDNLYDIRNEANSETEEVEMPKK
ncbi:hypothetical protein L1987_16559 [Smallanthus sonchifolius]|uniref:Uncharacterized protein n=1 Tax=Smallanthus sonchifolius TaxID=185202 RepID=A0ACB9JA72_9ASTR|nr:hypothetical protein L1987_16559 [Smallanthus sonchifolius]